MAAEILALSNPAFKAFLFYSTVCLVKMVMLAFKTTFLRLTKNVYSSPEDVKAFSKDKDVKPKYDDDDVERARRNHQNDVENIPLFIFLSFFLLFTGCSATTAIWHFRIFTISRILYTFCAQMAIPSPSRTLCFVVGTFANASMAGQIILATL